MNPCCTALPGHCVPISDRQSITYHICWPSLPSKWSSGFTHLLATTGLRTVEYEILNSKMEQQLQWSTIEGRCAGISDP